MITESADSLYAAYRGETTRRPHDSLDEAFTPEGEPRPAYRKALEELSAIGADELGKRMQAMADGAMRAGMSIRVTGTDEHRPYPLDFVPRIIEAEAWEKLSAGIKQRALALNAFLHDIYGERRIIAAGIISEEELNRAPGYDPEIGGAHNEPVHAHVCGVDLVLNENGEWTVIEDNLRVPAGVAFAASQRGVMDEVFPELAAHYDRLDPEEALTMLRETVRLAAGPHAPEQPRVAVLSQGKSDTVYFEHEAIAKYLDCPVVTPTDLGFVDGRLHYRDSAGEHPIDVMFARITKDELFDAKGFDGEVLGARLLEELRASRLVLVNAFGNGAADDKAIYPFVPQMISFYLDEEPILAQVPTMLCSDAQSCEEVLGRLDELVVKPIDGQGGEGITIGPDADAEELAEQERQIRANPAGFIAQEVVKISTLPTFDGETMDPRHVDLRALVQLRADGDTVTAHAVPAGLTRAAPAGSMVVNASKGGGSKDTWLLRGARDEDARDGGS